MRRHAPRSLSVAVDALRVDLEPATPLASVQRAWPEAAGAVIAGEARPVAERSGVVTVSCSSAVWAQELDLMGAELVERLNGVLGAPAVRSLRCVATPS